MLMSRYFLIDYYLGHLTEKRFTNVDERKLFLLQALVYPFCFYVDSF